MSLPTEVFNNTTDLRNYVQSHIVENNVRSINEAQLNNILNSILNIIDKNEVHRYTDFKFEQRALGLVGKKSNRDSLAYKDGVIVFVSESVGDNIYYSTDEGDTWNHATYSVVAQWVTVVSGPNGFVALAYGNAAYSADGITWTAATTPVGGHAFTKVVHITGSVFIAISSSAGIAYKTTDGGDNWSALTMPNSNSYYDCYYESTSGRLVVSSGNGTGNRIVYSDNQGVSWTTATAQTDIAISRMCYCGNSRWIAFSSNKNQALLSVDNGVTWNNYIWDASANPGQVNNNKLIYLGGSTVMYGPILDFPDCFIISYDSAASWQPISTGFLLLNATHSFYYMNGKLFGFVTNNSLSMGGFLIRSTREKIV